MPSLAAALVATVTAVAPLVAVTPSTVPPSTSSAAGCDAATPPFDAAYQTLGGGSSFVHRGRRVALGNGAVRNYSYGAFTSRYVPGDRIWVDRSTNGMPKDIRHPSTAQVQERGGWKQCGPFTAEQSGAVINWDTKRKKHYAVRVCIDHPQTTIGSPPPGVFPAVCGAWYTDAS